jgi:Tetratrico peptide repeat
MNLRRPLVAKAKRSLALLEELLAEKSAVLSQAQALTTMGMTQGALPLWAAAAALEERIAPLLDAQGDEREAAVHRISAASCYDKAGDPSRATNLYRAALAGPLRDVTRKEVEVMLAASLARLRALASARKTG